MAIYVWGLVQLEIVCSLDQLKHYPPNCAAQFICCLSRMSLLGGRKEPRLRPEAHSLPALCGLG